MRINRNETSRILNKNNKKVDINKLIAKYNLIMVYIILIIRNLSIFYALQE